jgi:hypothetical protein
MRAAIEKEKDKRKIGFLKGEIRRLTGQISMVITASNHIGEIGGHNTHFPACR